MFPVAGCRSTAAKGCLNALGIALLHMTSYAGEAYSLADTFGIQNASTKWLHSYHLAFIYPVHL